MTQVTIYRSTQNTTHRLLGNAFFSQLEAEPDVQVRLLDSTNEEFSIHVDGEKVPEKTGFPTWFDVISAIRSQERKKELTEKESVRQANLSVHS